MKKLKKHYREFKWLPFWKQNKIVYGRALAPDAAIIIFMIIALPIVLIFVSLTLNKQHDVPLWPGLLLTTMITALLWFGACKHLAGFGGFNRWQNWSLFHGYLVQINDQFINDHNHLRWLIENTGRENFYIMKNYSDYDMFMDMHNIKKKYVLFKKKDHAFKFKLLYG